MDEKAEEHRAARDLKLCLVQSLLLVSEKNVQERFLHPVNIRGDLHFMIIINLIHRLKTSSFEL